MISLVGWPKLVKFFVFRVKSTHALVMNLTVVSLLACCACMKQDIEFVDWSDKDLAAGISFAETVQKPQARQSTDKTLFISRDDIAWTLYTSKQGHLRTFQEAYLHTDCVNSFMHGKQAVRFDLFALRFSATADKAGCLQVRHCFTKQISCQRKL